MKQILLRIFNWDNFYVFMKRELKVFFFYLVVLSLFRIVFILWMHDYMGAATGLTDVALALWRGLRLSFQSAGVLVLAALIPTAFCNIFLPRWEGPVRQFLHALTLMMLSVLFMARFPYYRQFHSSFNQLMFNAVNDDMYALLVSLVQEFYLPVRLLGAFFLSWVLYRLMKAFLRWEVPGISLFLPHFLCYLGRVIFLLGVYLVSLLALFGGSLDWETAVDWENAGVTKDSFLNEAILDDLQAVYRAYTMNGRLEACNGLDFTTEDIRTLAARLTGKPADTDDLDVYLTRTAQGAQIEKPKHIFVIISESYANWPLLDKYKNIPIAEGMRSVIREDDSDYCRSFLPNGASTVSALTGVVTGFADANLYLTTMPEAFAAPYPTASAPQFRKLGYLTNFWYAGPATWERIGAFTTAQGYEHFYSRGDFGEVPGSVWGCDDEYLYDAVLQGVDPDRASFNVVLNVSNHSPYTIDLAEKGFDAEKVRAQLPEEAQGDGELLRELGHYWYADRELAKFIREVKEKYSSSLIIVVGDHADRYNIDKTPSLYERYVIPFIVTGRGVHKGMLLPDAAGSQIDIVPTIFEMIAPKGFTYMSLGSSLTRSNRMGVNYGFWITHDNIGKADTVPLVPETIVPDAGSIDEDALQDYINAVRSISWWRPKYGPILDETKLEDRK
jgi:phosphoglycerol transferase MdoB-like AlkP superfamily enzyme